VLIKTELIRFARNSSHILDFAQIRNLFMRRLSERGYPASFLNKAFNAVQYEQRAEFLTDKERPEQKKSNLMLFKVQYNPTWDAMKLGKILRKHWTAELQELTKGGTPLVCFKRAKSLQSVLVKATDS
jgi:hypothetical protein